MLCAAMCCHGAPCGGTECCGALCYGGLGVAARGGTAVWLGAYVGDSAWAGVVGAAYGLGMGFQVGGLHVSSCA